MNRAPAVSAELDGGSFRDREGRVYMQGHRVFRGLSDSALANFRALQETRFYRAFSDSGDIVASHEVDAHDAPGVDGAWVGQGDIAVTDPATGELLGHVPSADAGVTQAAIAMDVAASASRIRRKPLPRQPRRGSTAP